MYFWQEFSADGRFILSADRDFKIRVRHNPNVSFIVRRNFIFLLPWHYIILWPGYCLSKEPFRWSSWDTKLLPWSHRVRQLFFLLNPLPFWNSVCACMYIAEYRLEILFQFLDCLLLMFYLHSMASSFSKPCKSSIFALHWFSSFSLGIFWQVCILPCVSLDWGVPPGVSCLWKWWFNGEYCDQGFKRRNQVLRHFAFVRQGVSFKECY